MENDQCTKVMKKPFTANERKPKSVKKLKQFREENSRFSKTKPKGSSSEEEHKTNALASGAEEGRDKLR